MQKLLFHIFKISSSILKIIIAKALEYSRYVNYAKNYIAFKQLYPLCETSLNIRLYLSLSLSISKRNLRSSYLVTHDTYSFCTVNDRKRFSRGK